jgi:hypothetical protein
MTRLDKARQTRGDLEKLQQDLEKQILSRHAVAVKEADSARDQALEKLRRDMGQEKDKILDVTKVEANVRELLQLQDRIEAAINSRKSGELLTVSREMTYGRGSAENVKQLTSSNVGSFQQYQMSLGSRRDLQKHVADFVGLAERVPAPQMDVSQAFDSGGGSPNTRVFSLCYNRNPSPSLNVSDERYVDSTDSPAKEFKESGESMKDKKRVGKVNWKQLVTGNFVIDSNTFTKSLIAQDYELKNQLPGKATIYKLTVTSQKPLKTESELQCRIKVGPYRAVDVDATEEFFAVVEEASSSDQHRRVLLYSRHAENAVATYQPPSPRFQPSDVCFYTLGGQEMLLVSDEANDAIHVVRVGENSMTFLRYLTNDCDLLQQPTAMNVDVQGRLWVACKGGKIITMQPQQ